MMGSLRILDGGLFTTIQDSGRTGFRKYGIPTSGAMDFQSYELANWLVGNTKNSPLLELTLRGGRFKFESDAVIAITGALVNSKINDSKVRMNSSLRVKRDDEIELGFASRGCRSYIAIRGGLKVEKVMGSYSTYTIGKFGGFEGRSLQSGDVLEWEDMGLHFELREAQKEQIPYFSSKVRVRISKGPEWNWIYKGTQKKFLNSKFSISSKSNRMGIRLEGVLLENTNQKMISSPVIPGIIQLPPNGNPIILLQDGQTIGGYPRIAKVLDEDLWRLGQLKPGDNLGFILI
ncbi:MAG: biotin-dependent carboxyltransferase family protein [Balneolaceae bacterium]